MALFLYGHRVNTNRDLMIQLLLLADLGYVRPLEDIGMCDCVERAEAVIRGQVGAGVKNV